MSLVCEKGQGADANAETGFARFPCRNEWLRKCNGCKVCERADESTFTIILVGTLELRTQVHNSEESFLQLNELSLTIMLRLGAVN
jgi:hypothetical protein